jgi:hypothetical protein
MTRYHATAEGNVPFTAEEEAARDIEEAAFFAAAGKQPQETEKPLQEQIDELRGALLGKGVIVEADLVAARETISASEMKG